MRSTPLPSYLEKAWADCAPLLCSKFIGVFIVPVVSWLFLLTRWSVLRTIGASYLSTLTIIVPFLGYLIFFGSFQGSTFSIDFLALNAEVSVSESESFIRLKLTYVGLSIIGFATMLYKITCPSEVALYKSMRDYIQASVDVTFPSHARGLKSELSKKRWYDFAIDARIPAQEVEIVDVDGSRSTRQRTAGQDRSLERSEWLEANQNALNYLFSRKYEQADASGILARVIVSVGYAAGFILLLIPSITIFWPRFIDVVEYVRLLF